MGLGNLLWDVLYYFFMGVVRFILSVGAFLDEWLLAYPALVFTSVLVFCAYRKVRKMVVAKSLRQSRQRHLNQRLVEYGYGLDFSEQVDSLLVQRLARVIVALERVDDVKATRLRAEIRRDGAQEVILAHPVLTRAFDEIGGLRRLETNPVMLKRI